jgi:glycopeptide antibiotics resistance protein
LDYLSHVLIFIPFPTLLISANNSIGKKLSVSIVLFAGFFTVVFLESVQYFLPYRTFNINDLIANTFGFIIGYFLISVFNVINNTQKN